MRTDIDADYRVYMANLPADAVDQFIGKHIGVAREVLLGNLLYGGIAFLLAALWFALLPRIRVLRGGLQAMTAVAVVATTAQLLWLAYPVNHGRVLRHDVADTPIHEFLRAERDAHAESGGFMVARGSKAPDLPWILPPCTLLPERIRDLSIYEFIDRHSHKPFKRFSAGEAQLIGDAWVKCVPDADLGRPYLDLLGVRYVLSEVSLENAGRRVGPEWKGPHGEMFVYERETALPRAFVVPEVRVAADEDALLDALTAMDFDPRAAVLAYPEDAAGIPAPPDASPAAAARNVRFVTDETNEVVMQVSPGPGGYLVMNDTLMSGWTATVNGEEAQIHRGNLFMRVLPVPAGDVEVRMTYRTPGLDRGMWVTWLCVVVLVALLGWSLVRRRPAY